MKIAILGTKGVPGHHGVEVVVDSLLPHLAAMGHNVTAYGYDTYSQPTGDYLGSTIRTVKGSSRKNMEMISHMWNASWDTRKRGFDIVHIHNTDPCLLSWLPKARFGIMATSHGQAYARDKWGYTAKVFSKIAERFFIYVPRTITAVSKPLVEYYEQAYKKTVFYIPNGIKHRKAPPAEFLEKWKLASNGYLFCSAGRIERTKGLHTLLEAYGSLETDQPLIIAGGDSGSDERYFEELKRNKPANARFVGFLNGDDLFALYAHAKVFVFPSEYEAMSMALLEGLSFETPVVYSDIPANKTIAQDMGYSFTVSSAKSLADKITYVLNHQQEAKEKAKKAAKRIRKHHDWKTIAEQYSEIYMSFANK